MKRTLLAALALSVACLWITACEKTVADASASRDVSALKAENKNPNGTVWVRNVELSGANEVPPNDLGAWGEAILRITADKVLHSKVNVYDVPADQTLTAAHIHTGATGVNGPVYIGLCAGAAQFGIFREIQLTDAQYDNLLNGTNSLYVNAHSTVKPGGLVRGQLR